MTGGQSHDGLVTPQMITRQVRAEGVERVVVVTDEPQKYPDGYFDAGIEVFHRDRLDDVQRDLRSYPGVSVLVYDQTCAAEKRRRRKRGAFADPPKRAFINEAVCEGCGDCGVKSNCVSIEPLETEFGRKRVINQSSCNKDYSCINGFCPSFVSVIGGKLRRPGSARAATKAALQRRERRQAPLRRPRSRRAGAEHAAVATPAAVRSPRRRRWRRCYRFRRQRASPHRPCRRSTAPMRCWSPASAAPGWSPSARSWAWRRIWKARASPCWTWRDLRRRTAPS